MTVVSGRRWWTIPAVAANSGSNRSGVIFGRRGTDVCAGEEDDNSSDSATGQAELVLHGRYGHVGARQDGELEDEFSVRFGVLRYEHSVQPGFPAFR